MAKIIHNDSDAAKLLLNAYLKVLRVDLGNDSFSEVKIDTSEKDSSHGYSKKISEWLFGFAKNGNVYEEDLPAYFAFTNLDHLKSEFASGKESVNLRYRRRIDGEFRFAKMTLQRSEDYSKRKQICILYIENIDDDFRAIQEISRQKKITAALVYMYFACFYVDAIKNTYRKIYVAEEYNSKIAEKGSMFDIVDAFTRHFVVPDDPATFEEKFALPVILKKLRTRESYDYEYSATAAYGKIWCRIYAIAVDYTEDGAPQHILIAMQDVTRQAESVARNNNILKDAFSAAVAASTAKSEFMSRMSHDIRTPLNGIIGMTAIAGTHLDDKERITDCLAKITGASKHLLSLINDILDLSKIESGKVTLTDADFSLPSLIDEVISIVHGSIVQAGHEFNVYLHDIHHENVTGDNMRLQQVFLNLITNAIKYTQPHGKISVTLSEQPMQSANIGSYTFTVEDNGYGMSEEFLAKLFEPFERAEDSRIANIQGTGLGMTIVRTIVNMMGGDIQVESKENVGTKITVKFKIKLRESDEEIEKELLDLPVLVVDDDETICESAVISLKELGMRGDYCLSGAEAVQKVTTAHNNEADYYACLIDWQMPEMDGIETTRRIRAAVGPDMPIIIISAYECADIEEEARNAGANAFISKPLFKSRLQAAFTRLPHSKKENVEADLSEFAAADYALRTFLLVEDNELNREIAAEILSMTGAKVETAENGAVAVSKFAASPFRHYSMVFMDIRMPVMDGYEATRKIRALPRGDAQSVPIIALTADAFIEDAAQAKNAGMNRHLAKPIDLPRLLEVMKEYLK